MSIRPSDVQELQMWSDPQDTGIYLRDPISLGHMSPNSHPQFFAGQDVEQGIYWLREYCTPDPTIESPAGNTPRIGMTALYGIQSESRHLGLPGEYERLIGKPNAVLYTRSGAQPDDGYTSRLMDATPANRLFHVGGEGSDGPVEAVMDEMQNKIEGAWDEDEAMLGELVMGNVFEWYQIGKAGLVLREQVKNDPLLQLEPTLKVAASLHAERTDMTRKMQELGVTVTRSQLLAPELMIPEYRDELYAVILSGCVIKPEHMGQ
jgi:hypothetical protein